MQNSLVGIAVSALVGAAVALVAASSGVALFRGAGVGPPNQTTIRLTGTPSACTAVVYDDPVGNKHEKHVTWDINEDCSLEGRWSIELEFTPNAKGQFPFPTQTVRSQGNVNQFVHEKIKKNTEVDAGDFKYTIYLVQGSNRTKLLDPELEIVY